MRRDAGFTLLELLLALLILGLSMAAVARVLSTGVTASGQAEERLRLLAFAQNVMEGVGGVTPLEPGEQLLRLPDGLAARLEIRPAEIGPTPALPGMRGFTVMVTVGREGGAGPSVTLTGIRLGLAGRAWTL